MIKQYILLHKHSCTYAGMKKSFTKTEPSFYSPLNNPIFELNNDLLIFTKAEGTAK